MAQRVLPIYHRGVHCGLTAAAQPLYMFDKSTRTSAMRFGVCAIAAAHPSP
jgi:hypothetical protein